MKNLNLEQKKKILSIFVGKEKLKRTETTLSS